MEKEESDSMIAERKFMEMIVALILVGFVLCGLGLWIQKPALEFNQDYSRLARQKCMVRGWFFIALGAFLILVAGIVMIQDLRTSVVRHGGPFFFSILKNNEKFAILKTQ